MDYPNYPKEFIEWLVDFGHITGFRSEKFRDLYQLPFSGRNHINFNSIVHENIDIDVSYNDRVYTVKTTNSKIYTASNVAKKDYAEYTKNSNEAYEEYLSKNREFIVETLNNILEMERAVTQMGGKTMIEHTPIPMLKTEYDAFVETKKINQTMEYLFID